MSEGFLTRTECTAMKGIAIVGIMLHNYCHWLKDIARENEFTWSQWKCDKLVQVLQQPDDLTALHLMSFFGHYGVVVFLFLSGYGLVRKYEGGSPGNRQGGGEEAMPGFWRFIRYNYLKLFRLLIVGFVLFTMLDAITPGFHRYHWHEVVAVLGMFANFYPDPSQTVWPGPYWYFSITMQLYIVYRLLVCRRHWAVVVGLIAVCWLWQVCWLDDRDAMERLRYSLVGGVLPFGLGVLAGRSARLKDLFEKYGHRRVSALILLLSMLLTAYLSLLNPQTWLWAPVFVITGTIALVKLIPRQAMPYVLWIGSISAAIFVTHPLVRKIFYRPYYGTDMYAGLLLYVVATLLLSWLVKKIIDQIPSPRL